MAMMEPSPNRAGSMPQPYPPQPPSPTLTNPDMILPEYERASSPGYDDDRSHSPLMMWKNAHAAASAVDLHALTFTAGPITPTTPIIYGNGTMLSDIGEVTEVESTVGRPSPASRHRAPGAAPERQVLAEKENMADYLSSPTRVLDSVKRRAKEQASKERLRRGSADSASTITTTAHDRPDLFADFDDSMSVGDSVFQGDDEESVAESYVPDSPAREPAHTANRLAVDAPSVSGGSSVNGGGSGNEDQHSTTDLSKRAEQILANAKRRLTTMEGNLTRARSSLQMSSPTGFSDGSTPSPPFPLRLRDPSTTVFAPGHARIGSDNALRLDAAPKEYTPRSASALGAAGGYRQPLISSQSLGQIREDLNGAMEQEEPSYRSSADSAGDRGLDSVSEDVASPDLLRPSHESAQLDTFLSPTFGSFNEKGLTRSASVAQMRDLKDQMKDLKGKISSLREQARADSMKRRSLQSLRTPSPFTHARIEQWYGAEPKDAIPKSASTPNDVSGRNPWNGEVSTVDGESEEEGQSTPKKARSSLDEATEDDSLMSGYESQENGVTKLTHPHHHNQFIETPVVDLGADPQPRETETILEEDEEEVDESDLRTENGDGPPSDENQDGFATAGTDWESETGESEYHDAFQHPISHEDREDAFDYEHFILHSALGTINQQRLAGRGSFSSEDSVETTRGPSTYGKKSRSRSRTRRGSAGSISTVDSFATATEGRASRYSTNRSSFETARGLAVDETAVIDDYVVEEEEEDEDDDRDEQATTTAARGSSRSHRPATPPPPMTRKKSNTFSSAPATTNTTPNKRHSAEEQRPHHPPAAALARRPASSAAHTLHRPSVSSFDSTGTHRSFPLVGGAKKKSSSSNGSASPVAAAREPATTTAAPLQQQQQGDDHHQQLLLRNISESLARDAATAESSSSSSPRHPSSSAGALQALHHEYSASLASVRSASSLGGGAGVGAQQVGGLSREDQALVERTVAGLGRCVLGLTESGRASAESRMFRRRIDAARRVLEGLEPLAGAPLGRGGGGSETSSL